MIERKRHGRKLLIASLGIAAVSYVACGGDDNSSPGGPIANLMAPAGASGEPNAGGNGTGGTANNGGSGNTGGDSNNGGGQSGGVQDAAVDKVVIHFEDVLVANLIAPPPPDAKDDTK